MLTNEDFTNLKTMVSSGKVTAGQVKEALLTAARSGELDVMGLLACQMAGLLDAAACQEVGAAIVATAAAALAGKGGKRPRKPGITLGKKGTVCLNGIRTKDGKDRKEHGYGTAAYYFDEWEHILKERAQEVLDFIEANRATLTHSKDRPKDDPDAKEEETAAEKAA